MSQRKTLTELQFSALISENCRRWGEKSICIARLLFVEKMSVGDVANAVNCTASFVSQIKKKMEGIIGDKAFEDFIANTPPAREYKNLGAAKAKITRLLDAGYSTAQVVEYLESSGLLVTEKELITFCNERGIGI